MLVALAVQTQLHVESDTITATDVLYTVINAVITAISKTTNVQLSQKTELQSWLVTAQNGRLEL